MVKISPKNIDNIIIQSVKVELFSELFGYILFWVWLDMILSCANMQLYFLVIIWL